MVRAVFLAITIVMICRPQASAQARIVFDRYMTPFAGTSDLLALQHELLTIEDRVLPLKFGSEQRRSQLVAGILYRAGKLIALDVPQDHMLLVVGHEVFGHGARLRELGIGRISYSFDGPIPYGQGGAVTSFSGEFPDTPLSLLTIEEAGIEAQNVLADSISDAAIAAGRLHYREAWLYFESRYIGMTYILSANERSEAGHDVADFLETFKDACQAPLCTPISNHDVKRGAKFTLADPLLYFALYGFTSSYIGEGQATSHVPMIPLGRIRYLPSLGFEMTPYGTEYLFRNIFTSEQRAEGKEQKHTALSVTRITVRIGNTGASTPWAIDVRMSEVLALRGIQVGVAANVWKQPPMFASQTSVPLKTGAAASATFTLPLKRFTHSDWINATITAGYKGEGFVPGERLTKGAILRAGAFVVGR